jgi:hypothetical protein
MLLNCRASHRLPPQVFEPEALAMPSSSAAASARRWKRSWGDLLDTPSLPFLFARACSAPHWNREEGPQQALWMEIVNSESLEASENSSLDSSSMGRKIGRWAPKGVSQR